MRNPGRQGGGHFVQRTGWQHTTMIFPGAQASSDFAQTLHAPIRYESISPQPHHNRHRKSFGSATLCASNTSEVITGWNRAGTDRFAATLKTPSNG
jgi:hypothetical protein